MGQGRAVRTWQAAPPRGLEGTPCRMWAGWETPGHLASIGDGLELQGGQGPAVGSRQGKGVGDVWRWDAGQRAGLHHAVRMLLPDLSWRGMARGTSGVWPGSRMGWRKLPEGRGAEQGPG